MAPTTTTSLTGTEWEDDVVSRVADLPEFWFFVAEHSGFVGAWRLTGVSRASREGAKVWLRTRLPGFLLCGGYRRGEVKRGVWRLDLAALRWEHVSDLDLGRRVHSCCTPVRGSVVVLGGEHTQRRTGDLAEDCYTASVEILRQDSSSEQSGGGTEIVVSALPPLSRGPRVCAAAVPITEQGQVLLIGGIDTRGITSDVHKVDLATGVCTPLPSFLTRWLGGFCSAARLPDGRVVCVGNAILHEMSSDAEILEELPNQSSVPTEASLRWRLLPHMIVSRHFCAGCVLSDGRFAVFGGSTTLKHARIRARC